MWQVIAVTFILLLAAAYAVRRVRRSLRRCATSCDGCTAACPLRERQA